MSRDLIHRPPLSLELDSEPRVDSRWIAVGLKIEHRHLMRTIKKYQEHIESCGILRFQNAEIGGRGQPEKFCLLNETQSYFLLTLSRNTDQVIDLKLKLSREFTRLRRQAERRARADWQQARLEGKDARKHETDTIQAFVTYATHQGSTNAQHYYVNLTKMTHKALFLVEQGLGSPGSLRDLLNGMQLTFLATAEYVAAKALKDGMHMNLHYKEIYRLAKDRVEGYAATVGRTPLLCLTNAYHGCPDPLPEPEERPDG